MLPEPIRRKFSIIKEVRKSEEVILSCVGGEGEDKKGKIRAFQE